MKKKEEIYEIKRIKNEAYIKQLDRRVIILRAKTFVNLQKAIESISDEEAKALLYEASINVGKDSTKELLKEIKNKDFFKKLSKFYSSNGCGWFKIKKINIDPNKGGNIQIEQSFIAEEYGKSEKPVCDFLAGYFVGMLEEIYKKEYTCEETKCIAKGDKYCEFKIKVV
ncbi:MAG: V4R domain-containing protein [Nitrososphaerota archaeon]